MSARPAPFAFRLTFNVRMTQQPAWLELRNRQYSVVEWMAAQYWGSLCLYSVGVGWRLSAGPLSTGRYWKFVGDWLACRLVEVGFDHQRRHSSRVQLAAAPGRTHGTVLQFIH